MSSVEDTHHRMFRVTFWFIPRVLHLSFLIRFLQVWVVSLLLLGCVRSTTGPLLNARWYSVSIRISGAPGNRVRISNFFVRDPTISVAVIQGITDYSHRLNRHHLKAETFHGREGPVERPRIAEMCPYGELL